ncbi:hypothetical protein [Aeromonas bivalvium]|uniref:hypothetical protein n=1 Tax=Aeromonas bivalvium TaxID=440079 RepID=UPI0038D04A58
MSPLVFSLVLGSALLHVGYYQLLARAYGAGSLAQRYTLMRGGAILLLFIPSLLLEGMPQGTALAGIALIAAALILLGLKGMDRQDPSAWLCAGLIACYTLVDGMGARASGDQPVAYVLWLVVLEGGLMLALARRALGVAIWPVLRRGWRLALLGGACSTLAYAIVVWAMTQAPLAQVSALRESGILISFLIGAVCFQERLGRGKWLAALALLGGVLLLRLG